MFKIIKLYFFIIAIIVLTGCGFQPVYKDSKTSLNIADYRIHFNNDPAYEIKNEIQEIFNSSSLDSTYQINLSIQEESTPLIVNTNGTVSKYRLEVVVYFDVNDSVTNLTIYQNIVRGFAEYFVQTSEIQTEEKRKQALTTATQDAMQMMLTKIQSNFLKQ